MESSRSERAAFVSGLSGGIAQVLVGHPFDTVKAALFACVVLTLFQVRLQTQSSGQSSNALNCALETLKGEGAAGFYRGVSSPILGIGLWYRSFLTLICL